MIVEKDENSHVLPDLQCIANRRWALDMHGRSRFNNNSLVKSDLMNSESYNPIGYVERSFPAAAAKPADPNLKVRRGWDIALDPVKQIPMNLFILWMAGNSVAIFPIMMVMMMFLRPIQAIFSMQTTFKKIEGDQAHLQCFVYFIGNLIVIGLAMYKCHNMGLLPTYTSDWLAFIEQPPHAEWCHGGVIW